MTRTKKIAILLFFLPIVSFGQGLSQFNTELVEITIPGMPALQSFAWGKTSDGKWLLVCGRTDGLHDHRPPFSFPANQANDDLWVVDPGTKTVWSQPVNALSNNIKNALTATNTQFEQVGDVLYIIGGYGVRYQDNQHKTHPTVTALDVTPLANAIISNQPIASHIRQLTDSRFRITGGYLHRLDSTFYLVGGQNFDGRYNPHNGPSFTQTYTESLKKFRIADNGSTLQITNYSEISDSLAFHRRDYNVVKQIFPSGDTGITAFTGVFRPDIDLPFLNTVDIDPQGYQVRTGFQQLLNQYHSAHLPVYDQSNNRMHTLFFGGIGMYYPDTQGNLVVDSLVPFVKTISRVIRFSNDTMKEYFEPNRMPAYLGAGAEFIPSDSVQWLAEDILDLNSASGFPLAGYIVGGIQSTDKNIFMMFSGSSQASNRIFKVYLKPSFISIEEPGSETWPTTYFPNPVKDRLYFETEESVRVELLDSQGKKIREEVLPKGKTEWEMDEVPSGAYILKFMKGTHIKTEKLVKE